MGLAARSARSRRIPSNPARSSVKENPSLPSLRRDEAALAVAMTPSANAAPSMADEALWANKGMTTRSRHKGTSVSRLSASAQNTRTDGGTCGRAPLPPLPPPREPPRSGIGRPPPWPDTDPLSLPGRPGRRDEWPGPEGPAQSTVWRAAHGQWALRKVVGPSVRRRLSRQGSTGRYGHRAYLLPPARGSCTAGCPRSSRPP